MNSVSDTEGHAKECVSSNLKVKHARISIFRSFIVILDINNVGMDNEIFPIAQTLL